MTPLTADVRTQRRLMGNFIKEANVRMTRAKTLMEKLKSGELLIKDVKEELKTNYSEAQGAYEKLASIDQWIAEEVRKDRYAQEDPNLAAMYTKAMKGFTEERNFEGMKMELMKVMEDMDELVRSTTPENQEEWDHLQPTPIREEPEVDDPGAEEPGFVVYEDNQESEKRKVQGTEKKPLSAEDIMRLMKEANEQMTKGVLAQVEKMMESRLKSFETPKRPDKGRQRGFRSKDQEKSKSSPPIDDSDDGDDSSSDEELEMNKKEHEKPKSKPIEFNDDSDADGYTTATTERKGTKKPMKGMKPKTIELKKFSGKNPLDYEEWRTMFMKLYGNSKEMDSIDKLYTLKAYTTHNAHNLVSAVRMKEGNFKIAMKILDKKYKSGAKPLEELHHKFDAFQIDQQDYNQMLTDTSMLAAIVYEMKNEGSDIDQPGIYMHMIKKYPKEIQRKLIIKTKEEDYKGSFETMIDWIQQILDTEMSVKQNMERNGFEKADYDITNQEVNMAQMNRQNNSGMKLKRGNQSFQKEGSQPVSNGNAYHGNDSKECPFHEDNEDKRHPAWKCPKPEDIVGRLVFKLQLCTLCFTKGHEWRECPKRNKNQCRKCNFPHNTKVHDYMLAKAERRRATRVAQRGNQRPNDSQGWNNSFQYGHQNGGNYSFQNGRPNEGNYHANNGPAPNDGQPGRSQQAGYFGAQPSGTH